MTGEIDWARRFDHMQQHTGQHVLSAAFDRLFGVRTESFHMGQLSATIDLAREVTAAEIAKAEDEANRIVWEDRPVAIRFATAEEAAAMPLRKESGARGSLRLIDVQDYDLSACGGTHVERTGAIGVIAIGGWEKFKRRLARRVPVRRPRAAAVSRVARRAGGDAEAPVGAADRDGRGDRAHAGRGEGRCSGRFAASRRSSPSTRPRRYWRKARRLIVEALEGWDAQGLKGDRRCGHRRATGRGRRAVYDDDTRAGRDRARRECDRRCRRGVEAADGEVRRQGRRQARPRQGGGLAANATELVAAARALLTSVKDGIRRRSGVTF